MIAALGGADLRFLKAVALAVATTSFPSKESESESGFLDAHALAAARVERLGKRLGLDPVGVLE